MKLEGTDRRLPIYLTIDVSGSMSGAPIDAVNSGLRDFERALKADDQARECAYVSVLAFSNSAAVKTPLTDASQFTAPTLTTETSTNFGAAFNLLGNCIDKDLRTKDANHPGDWKPLVFFLTDGQPTDSDWEQSLATFQARRTLRPANVIAIGCGPAVNDTVLKKITPTVLLMTDTSPEKFRALFQWLSQSTKAASRAASQQAATAGAVQFPQTPPGIAIAL
jgi:uncharacterized protein YegL